MSEEKIILYDSPEAASIQTVTGWVSSRGEFYGNGKYSEECARRSGATHFKCEECGSLYPRGRWCAPCHEKRRIDRRANAERVPWDGVTMLFSETLEDYSDDPDDLLERLRDRAESDEEAAKLTYDDLRLWICEPNMPNIVETDYWCDDLPEDEHDVPFQAELDALNAAIRECGPLSWSPGDKVPTFDK